MLGLFAGLFASHLTYLAYYVFFLWCRSLSAVVFDWSIYFSWCFNLCAHPFRRAVSIFMEWEHIILAKWGLLSSCRTAFWAIKSITYFNKNIPDKIPVSWLYCPSVLIDDSFKMCGGLLAWFVEHNSNGGGDNQPVFKCFIVLVREYD